MEAVFGRVLEISISGAVMALAVLALRPMLRKAPKQVVCLLWCMVVLRLLVPFEIQWDWSLQPGLEPLTLLEEGQESFGSVYSGPVEQLPEQGIGDAAEYPLQILPREETEVSRESVLGWIWLTGAAALGIHGLVSYLRLKRRVRDAVILEEGIWICPGLDTAFVLGLFRPEIYLPVLDARERELVLAHERSHIRRLDHWWKPAAYAAVSLHWFNPLAWATYVLMCRDMELACDQETVRGMDSAQRKAYSEALLRCAARRSGIVACPVAFGEISVKERIKMVLNYKKPGFWVTVIALITAAAVGIFFLTSPKEPTELWRCEEALKQWQEMEAYQFKESQSNMGAESLHDWSGTEFWSSGDEHLMKFSYAEGLGEWKHWQGGKGYSRQFGSEDAEWTDTGWQSAEFREQEVIPWILRLDWEQLTVNHWEAADDGKIVLLTVEFPTLGPGTLSFHFDDTGALRSVSRSFTGAEEVVVAGTIELVETDRTEVEKEMDRFGVNPEPTS